MMTFYEADGVTLLAQTWPTLTEVKPSITKDVVLVNTDPEGRTCAELWLWLENVAGKADMSATINGVAITGADRESKVEVLGGVSVPAGGSITGTMTWTAGADYVFDTTAEQDGAVLDGYALPE